jgi:hypothetical protein
MPHRSVKLPLVAAMPALVALLASALPVLAGNSPTPVDDDFFQPATAEFGGADPLATDRTVQHWSGQTENGVDHVTYRYNMVGVSPDSDGAATIPVDIIPINVNIDGATFSGSSSVPGVLNSPIFQNFDYSWAWSSTQLALGPDGVTPVCCAVRQQWDPQHRFRIPFEISADNTGQLLDATMRAQFNKVGSGYHLYLDQPTVWDAVTIDVPSSRGTVFVTPVGWHYGGVNLSWFQARVQNLMKRSNLDPTHLVMFLTTDVVLFKGNDPTAPGACCGLGGHGAGHATGGDNGPTNGNGNQPVQTFVWGSWLTPGVSGPRAWVQKDIASLSHELTEWAIDPFNSNTVLGWRSRIAPQYGCSNLLESADPLVNAGFSVGNPGSNHYNVNPFPPFNDGMFHVSDEAFIPWFMSLAADNTFSQPTQSGAGGRYTLMGDNALAEFHGHAAGDYC